MAKGRANTAQIAFTFDPPEPATHAAALAGMDARIAHVVGEALRGDPRAREIIAAEMSILLQDEVTKGMLDAYASPARDGHNISFSRMLALIAVTSRFDLLDRELREIGVAVLIGEELQLARLGHLKSQIANLSAEARSLERMVKPITRGGRG